MLKFHTFVMLFNPSYKDCWISKNLFLTIVSRMSDTAGTKYFEEMRSTLFTIRSFFKATTALKLLRLQLLEVFLCRA